MKAILTEENFPKFLKVNNIPESRKWNKYILKPFKTGEIVKVVPFKKQKYLNDLKVFRQYVTVIRKDDNGDWSLEYTWNWSIFEKLSKKI